MLVQVLEKDNFKEINTWDFLIELRITMINDNR